MTDPSGTHPLIAVHGTEVRGLDPATGHILWEYGAGLVVARIALAHGRVYALDNQSKLHCLEAKSGAHIGTVQIDRPERSGCALIADGDRLYVATSHSVVALDANGNVLWQQRTGGAFSARAGLGLPGAVMQPDFNES
ncbi:MAG: PQQ-binding-like beta-propeller repeat protein [Deltaproteobacteria bacterium]|nr:PQQ-binding-like beta-propeller repeat protein [Deltaproteobacteria bacterium]